MPPDLLLDRTRRLLLHDDTAFDPIARRWTSATDIAGEPIGLRAAVRWLQTESGNRCRVPVAIIGPRAASAAERRVAFEVGGGLAALGVTLLCGGKGGVMEAACEGAASRDGISVGLLPDPEPQAANPFVTIPLATGIGEARNAIVARAALALVAIGSSYGTMSEIALGLQFGRPVLSLLGSAPVPGTRAITTVDEALDAVCRIVLALP